MKVISALVAAQLLTLVTGNDGTTESKRTGCWYLGATLSEENGPLYPEDIDVSICSNLIFQSAAWNMASGNYQIRIFGDAGIIPRLTKLKEKKPDLKLILFLDVLTFLLVDPTARAKAINSGVEWLNSTGFDGLSFPYTPSSLQADRTTDFFCELKSELDKHGYIVTAMIMDDFSGKPRSSLESITKLASCVDHIQLTTTYEGGVTGRTAALKKNKAAVEAFIDMGVPPRKIQISAIGFPMIFTLRDRSANGLGANVSGPGYEEGGIGGGFFITYEDLNRKLNDSSLGWTFRRDEETKEPYAFTNAGIWTSYEDTTSVEYKASYVLEKGLGGIDIYAMELEDTKGTGGHGKFPLTRATYNALRRGN